MLTAASPDFTTLVAFRFFVGLALGAQPVPLDLLAEARDALQPPSSPSKTPPRAHVINCMHTSHHAMHPHVTAARAHARQRLKTLVSPPRASRRCFVRLHDVTDKSFFFCVLN